MEAFFRGELLLEAFSTPRRSGWHYIPYGAPAFAGRPGSVLNGRVHGQDRMGLDARCCGHVEAGLLGWSLEQENGDVPMASSLASRSPAQGGASRTHKGVLRR